MTPMQLMSALATEFGVSVRELTGADRSRTLAAMRGIAMAAVRDFHGLSYPELARLFCRLDHTTAISNVRRSVHYRGRYPWLAQAVVRVLREAMWQPEMATESLEMGA